MESSQHCWIRTQQHHRNYGENAHTCPGKKASSVRLSHCSLATIALLYWEFDYSTGSNESLRKDFDLKNNQSMFYENRTFQNLYFWNYSGVSFPPSMARYTWCFSKYLFLRFGTCRIRNYWNKSDRFYYRHKTENETGKDLWDTPR